jgi:hypothetical protein
LGSIFFHASHALKKTKEVLPDVAAPSSNPSPMSTNAHPYPVSPFGYPFFPNMMPTFMPYPNLAQPLAQPWPNALGQPLTQPPARAGDQEPPSSPPPADSGSVEDFYQQFNISPAVQEGLSNLGFQIGDDLSQVPMEDVKQVQIKLLDWRRVLKHYREYKHFHS